MWRWRLTGVHSGEIPPFIIGTGSREIDIACLLDGWAGIFAFLLPHTHTHTETDTHARTHRVVSNDLTWEVGRELLLERARNWQWFYPRRAYEKRRGEESQTFTGEATPEVISCRLFTSRPSILLCKYYYWPSRTPFQWKIDARNLVLRWKKKKRERERIKIKRRRKEKRMEEFFVATLYAIPPCSPLQAARELISLVSLTLRALFLSNCFLRRFYCNWKVSTKACNTLHHTCVTILFLFFYLAANINERLIDKSWNGDGPSF